MFLTIHAVTKSPIQVPTAATFIKFSFLMPMKSVIMYALWKQEHKCKIYSFAQCSYKEHALVTKFMIICERFPIAFIITFPLDLSLDIELNPYWLIPIRNAM